MNLQEPLRIAMTTRAPFLSGAETALMQLAQGLADVGHAVMIICGQDGQVAETYRSDDRLRVEICPLAYTDKRHPLRFWLSARRLSKLLVDHRADVLHANDIPSLQAASFAARRLQMPRVSHARFLIEGPDGARWFLRYGCERVVSVSDFLKDHLLSVAPDVFNDLVVVSRDGIVVPELPSQADRLKARESLGIDLDAFVFLFFGQFTPVKGLEELIPAIGKVRPEVLERSRFYLVGDDLQNQGSYRHEIQQLAGQWLAEFRVEFPGFRRDIPAWLTACNCVLVPSRVDPLGMSAMESMAGGRAVIGCRVGGIPEMIDQENTGLLVDSGDIQGLAQAMETLAADPARADRMGLAGRKRMQEMFSLDRHVSDMEQIYRELLAGQRH
ncbi:MAG: glycosyltransferase family 4 protein [Phycisphaerae bacterium]